MENVTAPSPVKERQGGAQGVMGTRVPASMIIHEIMDDHDLVKPWFIHVYTHMVHNLFYPRRMYDLVLWGYLLGEMTKNR